jgi:hypothetical protein
MLETVCGGPKVIIGGEREGGIYTPPAPNNVLEGESLSFSTIRHTNGYKTPLSPPAERHCRARIKYSTGSDRATAISPALFAAFESV